MRPDADVHDLVVYERRHGRRHASALPPAGVPFARRVGTPEAAGGAVLTGAWKRTSDVHATNVAVWSWSGEPQSAVSLRTPGGHHDGRHDQSSAEPHREQLIPDSRLPDLLEQKPACRDHESGPPREHTRAPIRQRFYVPDVIWFGTVTREGVLVATRGPSGRDPRARASSRPPHPDGGHQHELAVTRSGTAWGEEERATRLELATSSLGS